MRKTWLPWLILSPSLLFLLLFTWFPLGRSVYDSLFDTRMANAQYVGLDNFARLFADNVFWQSLGNNLLYILLTVMPGVTLRVSPPSVTLTGRPRLSYSMVLRLPSGDIVAVRSPAALYS